MSTFNLDFVLRPRSIAVVVASERAGSLGRLLMENLMHGGFKGPIYPVNARCAEVLGVRAYPDMAALPETVDLAVVAIPAAGVPDAIAAAARRGAIVISAGLGGAGSALQVALLAAARTGGVRIVGPNTLGVLVPGVGLNASFAHLNPPPRRRRVRRAVGRAAHVGARLGRGARTSASRTSSRSATCPMSTSATC